MLPSSITSSMHFFKRSSNSPRYLLPATMPDTSSVINFVPRKTSGTWFDTISCAKPSATAVLPVPGSPIKSGLFFCLRDKICIARSISRARPITGSNFPSRARCVKSMPNSLSPPPLLEPESKGFLPANTGLWPIMSFSASRMAS